MLIEICNAITTISEDGGINSDNYMEGINYIGNLYNVLNELKLVVSLENVTFLPTFKGYYTCNKHNIEGSEKESQMKLFKIKSSLFLEDKQIRSNIKEKLLDISEDIKFEKDMLTVVLK
jgi:hypothetical protein